MATTQIDKAQAFRTLHEHGTFIIPNPWDIGTARLLARLDFAALATTSAGHAFSLGRRDNTVDRSEAMLHIASIASAVELPVSADLENGFGDDPDTVAETIRLTAAAGAVGGSIEDSTAGPNAQYPLAHAVARIRAAVAAARSLPFPFTLTARAENYLVGRPDLADTIARLQAYQDAGADVLYAPGLPTANDIATVVKSVDRPVNVVAGLVGSRLSVAELAQLGVRRISLGSTLARVALGAFLRAAEEMRDRGTFSFADEAVSYRDITARFET
jgi:2-methylisocitrate lyase-like PEP mutase family enzyme